MIINKRFKTLMILFMVLFISILSATTRDESDAKGLSSLNITAQIEYGSDPVNFIFNRINSTTYTMENFNYDSATTEYNYSTYSAAEFLKLTFPATGNYQLEAKFFGSSIVTTFTQASVNGIITVPLTFAGTSAGMDASGNPNADTQNNVLTIVADYDSADPKTYTLRFRRRAENLPTAGTNITISGTVGSTFTALVTGSNTNAANINGDNLSSLQEINWSVNSDTGTAYFDDDDLIGLSNGTITVTATLRNNASISATSVNYTLSGLSNWEPHLGRLELSYPARNSINITPSFSAEPDANGSYLTSIVDSYSNIRLNLMAPSDCQVFIDDARVSSNGESVLRVGPTDPNANGYPTAITFNIKVVNSQGTKDYILNIQREINNRIKYGRDATTALRPHLKSTIGDVFGLTSAATNKFTVQAWVRWTSDPSTNLAWANIVSQTTSNDGSSGSFWLQHNYQNSSFEFAIRPTGTRVYVLSDPAKVTIQQGIWYLVTGVYNAGPVKIYVNDQDVTQSARSTTGNLQAGSTSRFNIGKMAYGDRPFNGNIRNVRMWVGEARTPTEIAADYADTPLAGSGSDNSDFSWPLNETSGTTGTTVAPGNGGVDLTMSNITTSDFVASCVNNRFPGKALIHRPERMDLSSEDSESVILVQTQGYSGSSLRFDIVGVQDDVSKGEMEVWDHVSKTWISPADIEGGVLINAELGDPTSGTFFWVPVRKGTSLAGSGRYVDDDTETGYDGNDTGEPGRILYNSKILLPEVKALGTTFPITGTVSGTPEHSIVAGKRYVILGYDAVEKGKLITGTSSNVSSKDGKAVVSYTLLTDTPLYRVEVRTQDDTLLTNINSEVGWDEETDLGDITLPVELSSFTVSAISNGAKLQWVSQSESGLMGYHVYRSESEDFNTASIVSPVIEATNSPQTHVYTYTDIDILTQTQYYYWLKASDYSGEFSLYGPMSVILTQEGESIEIPLITGLDRLYPNPFNPEINIRYSLKETADVNLSFYNLKGQKVHIKEISSQPEGHHKYTWDASEHSSGIYFVVFKSGNIKETRKVILSK